MDEIEYARRATAAENKAAQAYLRLLTLIERHDSGQARIIAHWLAGFWHGGAQVVDITDLRALDVAICDDVLACLDAFRWGRRQLFMLIPEGEQRTVRALAEWQLD